MANCIAKLQFATMVDYQTIFFCFFVLFCMVSLIIPDKEYVKQENLHVYLAPLIEEL